MPFFKFEKNYHSESIHTHTTNLISPPSSYTVSLIRVSINSKIIATVSTVADNEIGEANVPGVPGVDYPIFGHIPDTDFQCSKQQYPGFYSDIETGCQRQQQQDRDIVAAASASIPKTIMMSESKLRLTKLIPSSTTTTVTNHSRKTTELIGGKHSFLCPNGTIFSQEYLICNWWYNVKCDESPRFYPLNRDVYASGLNLCINGANHNHHNNNNDHQQQQNRDQQPQPSMINKKNKTINQIELSTPYAILKQSPLSNKVDVITPESDGQWKMMTCLSPTKNIARNGRKFNTQNHTNPSSQVLIETSNLGSNCNHNNQAESSGHSFGVLCLDQESVNLLNRNNNVITNTKVDSKHGCLGRKESNQQDAQLLIDNNEQSLVVNPVTTNNSPSKLTRRSSRLINSDTRSIKENSTSAKKIVVDRRVTPVKRCRGKISFDKSQKIVRQNNNENDSTLQERSSANGLLELIKKFAIAY
ncbi:hypothetical protein DERF_012402 [Dermatophagoides farinae]|uniref:Chitin-binding type-2 domain-containing protein n=1 Tax=Dermatophagoides farinae TaxID=6954 RepID=A0A922HS28_DERFA|nr:hypothetical protein DERF_012402 [Dermatophagoides farinae]